MVIGMNELKRSDVMSICDMMLFGLDNATIAKDLIFVQDMLLLLELKRNGKMLFLNILNFPDQPYLKNK